MKQTYRLNEAELNRLISESVYRVLNEEADEAFLSGIRNTLGAAKDAFMNGTGYNYNKASRDRETARLDKEKLRNKYGVDDTQATKSHTINTWTSNDINSNNETMNQQIQQLERQKEQKIEQITAQYNAKIKNIETKFGAKNNKINTRAQNRWDKYTQKRDKLVTQYNDANKNKQKAKRVIQNI